MTSAASTTGRASERLPLRPSSNGGPPRPPESLMPLLVIALAFLVGFVAARLIDWRTHAHPDD